MYDSVAFFPRGAIHKLVRSICILPRRTVHVRRSPDAGRTHVELLPETCHIINSTAHGLLNRIASYFHDEGTIRNNVMTEAVQIKSRTVQIKSQRTM